MMPEPVDVNVDFISGDVTPQNGVFRSAFEARCIAPRGKPWDLMAWGFSWNGKDMPMSNKSARATGTGSRRNYGDGRRRSFYYTQNRDLSIRPWIENTVAELSAFCRERQAFVHKAQAIPQIAIVYPASYLKESNSPFVNTNALQGILYALLDNQFCAEILMEHHLPGKIQNYPLIIVPECKSMDAATKQMLVDYVKTGWNLLVTGAGVASIFKDELGISSFVKTEEKQIFINAANRLGAIRSVILETKPGNEVEILSSFTLATI